ncbi:translocation/assembly module TamB [Pontibacter sp. BT213]|uniref:Translocation/assembly module TamB n=1 Tax=Pontibacter fetidus TaxID=2700082 RepID=A0A6B2GZB5_9BACT|nr:translocation/assembly module TamB [Pontibacter fetidus]NDK55371.1 translocation/assembly module TamB [Pontibacter fetidus]
MIILVIALQFPKVQTYAAKKGANYLSDMLDTKVTIGGFTTDWRNAMVLKEVYIEDQQQDTLWYSQRLGVDMNISGLLRGNIDISKIDLDHGRLNLHIRPDSSSNFDFLIEAFATDTTAATPADTTAMAINLDVINLDDVHVNFKDEAGGNLIETHIGQFNGTMDELNLEEEKYLVDKVALKNTWIKYEQTKLPPETEPQPITYNFGLNKVDLEKVKLSYINRVADQRIELDLGKANLTSDNIDLPNARIDLSNLDLHNSTIVYAQEKYKPTDSLAVNPAEIVRDMDESVEKTQGKPVNWVITLGETDISGVNIKFDNFNTPVQKRGMDYDHLYFSDVVLQANNLKYSRSRTELDLNQLQLKERSGFKVENFQANILFDSVQTKLTNLDLKTGRSHIRRDLAIGYTSLDDLAEKPGNTKLDLNIVDSRIAMQDVLYFMPELRNNPSFRSVMNSTLNLSGDVEGTVDNMIVRQLRASGLNGTIVNVTGNIRNATNPDKLFLDLDVNQLQTSRATILAFAPAGTIPPNIRIPERLSMEGTFEGSMTNFDTRANINSSIGNLTVDANMGGGPKGAEPFTATIKTGGFAVDKLITDSLGVGTVAGTIVAKGQGLTPETMVADVKADLTKLEYNNYTYQNIKVDGDINKNLFTVKARSADPNLDLALNGTFNLRNAERANYNFNLDLNQANLQALNFYGEPLSIKGKIKANFTGADMASLNGTLAARQLVVEHKGKVYPADSLMLNLQQKAGKTDVKVRSDIMVANLNFGNTLETLPTALQKHFSNYFDLQPDPPFPANLSLEDFAFNIDLKKPAIVTSFVPGLEQLQTSGPVTGSYDGETQTFKMDGVFPKIKYTDYTLNGLTLQVRGDRNQINYSADLTQFLSPSLRAKNVALTGAARDNDLVLKLAVAEDSTDAKFIVGGVLNSLGRGYRFAFNPDQLVINGDKWTVSQDNFLQFDTDFIYANNINLQHNNMSLGLNSQGPVGPTAPLVATFKNFEIDYLTRSFQQSDSLMSGTINGNATLRNIMSDAPGFTSDITVTDFAYEGVPVGDLALVAGTAGKNRYTIDAKLTDEGNQMLIDGFVEMQPNATLLNLTANIASLNIKSLQGFTAGAVKNMDGNASGNLRITGTLADPNILGELNFNQAQFTITQLGSLYKLQNERMVFNENGISLPEFTLTDSLGNELELNGNIYTQNYTDYRFDLTANTDKFLALNSTAKDNELYYGTVYIDAGAAITGTMATPVVQTNVKILPGSAFTIVIPADEVGAAERDGIVEFVNLNDSATAIIGGQAQQDSAQVTGFVGVDVRSQISVTDETPITIILDPITGDNLVVKGTADPLFIGMKPSGEINMSGRYSITEGKYSMDFYDLVSRELAIEKGSYIAWTGDPLQANMQVKAIYNVETAPMELVASQIGGTQDPILQNDFTFQVFVDVEGEMLKPEIGFDIQVPEQQRTQIPREVLTSLGNLRTDEAEMNKQVFSLLVLNRFMAPDPFTSSGGGFASTARNSLSQVMSDQLSNLTQRYAGGLGLELGLDSYEDYSSGTAQGRTDLNVALRQQFLNDRMTVRVGTDIGLEGGQREQSSMSGFAGDISVEYSLTSDGRLRVQAFQRNQYEDFLEGDVRATGAGLIYQREYDNFSDLFRNLEERHKRERERRLAEAEKIREDITK